MLEKNAVVLGVPVSDASRSPLISSFFSAKPRSCRAVGTVVRCRYILRRPTIPRHKIGQAVDCISACCCLRYNSRGGLAGKAAREYAGRAEESLLVLAGQTVIRATSPCSSLRSQKLGAAPCRGDKSTSTDKQKRQPSISKKAHRGLPEDEAERRAWATVNKETGVGKKTAVPRQAGIPRAIPQGGTLGGKAAASRPAAAARSAAAKKAAAARNR